jgi:CheY-like chemotaxis protein/two-component sensor histidine kinase
LSHELRTPLNAILGWSQIMRRPGIDQALLKRALDTIERNARAQTQLIEDLLDMSRIVSGKLRLDMHDIEAAPVVEAAAEAVRPAAEAKGVRLEVLFDPVGGTITGDASRLQQVVWNLLSNAIKFTPRGGHVQVVVERVDSRLEIRVADTGDGIAPEFLPHVFERFSQADGSASRKYTGLGVGLAIVKNLIELHGGTVHVESAGVGRGSLFTVRLPLAVMPAYSIARRLAERSPHISGETHDRKLLSGVKVLVVDDEADARELIQRVLENCSAEVLTASSAAEALPAVLSFTPHVLVSDIGMPGRDGYDFIREVRSLRGEPGLRLPAVALTAFARSEDRTRAMLAGYQVHISKPVEPNELIATVASLAGRTG